MNRKGLAILMRTRMKPPTGTIAANDANLSHMKVEKQPFQQVISDETSSFHDSQPSTSQERNVKLVHESMREAITMNKSEVIDTILSDFSRGYYSLSHENRHQAVLVLAREYDLDRKKIRELMQQYLGLELPPGDVSQMSSTEGESSLSTFYRTERSLRQALKPMYGVLFERLNKHPGGLKFLCVLRADVLSILSKENISSLRALDSYLKENLMTWLSPATLELHQITWDDSASFLEKIVAYEAVHPISNLVDLKRRLGVGRRCFGYLHPAIPGEPLIFIEVALLKNIAQTIQEVLWDNPPIRESEATCALFYSISATQPGLAGINLGKFLIKRVIELVKKDMPHISTFATLSPIPGYLQWLLSKLASQSKLVNLKAAEMVHLSNETVGSTFREDLLRPEEEKAILSLAVDGKSAMDVMLNLLTSSNFEWAQSVNMLEALQFPLMRLCARYLCQEKKRGKALDSVGNFHLQNGATIGQLNWMADRSEKGLNQSAGIMVNYIYRLDMIEENAQSYFSTGHIEASPEVCQYLED
ncbi:hypothetical protein H6P81_007527 [Aristolochia fimbriata]|uniref:Malonyl-CoA decarboxylase n=1 Tax=Aristolochia fimbriata TaxID=158543 RepID=A0AAV7F509_ARIFI|nr:hypothetical protein H6P81_007527 [Aristolochia fimbriata]